jgi:hypothetical protein
MMRVFNAQVPPESYDYHSCFMHVELSVLNTTRHIKK